MGVGCIRETPRLRVTGTACNYVHTYLTASAGHLLGFCWAFGGSLSATLSHMSVFERRILGGPSGRRPKAFRGERPFITIYYQVGVSQPPAEVCLTDLAWDYPGV